MDYTRTAVIVLADTRGPAHETPLALLPFWGTPLVRHAALTALESACGPVVVVTGAHASYVRRVLDGLNLTLVVTDPNSKGSGEALQAGLRALGARNDLTGVVVVRAEQAMVTAPRLRQLVDVHRTSRQPLLGARYAGGSGLPAYIARVAFSSVFALTRGDEAERLLERCDPEVSMVDCPEAEPSASRHLTQALCSGGAWDTAAYAAF